jgi:DNA-binding transcriptional ArsR family regulator
MRPLYHPAPGDLSVEAILYALSDPVRAAIYGQIAGSSCAQNCSTFLKVNKKDIPKSTLSQHLKILREAGLIRGERQGVEMRITSRCADLEKRFPGLIPAIVKAYSKAYEKTAAKSKASKRTAKKR